MSENIANIIDVQTEAELQELIAQGGVIVDFHAAWCGPCKAMKPGLEEVAKAHPELLIAKVDIDALMEAAVANQVRGVPTLIVYDKQAKQVDRVVGSQGTNALEILAAKALS